MNLICITTLIFASHIFSHTAFSQTVINTIQVDGVSIPKSSAKQLKAISAAESAINAEKQLIEEALKKPLTPCEQEELELRKKDVEFTEKNKKQMEEIFTNVIHGLKKQKAILSDFANGIADEEQNAQITFTVHDDHGVPYKKTIPLTDLIRYINKFETEAATVGNSEAEIEKFLNKYRLPQRSNDPEYFNLALEEAKRAYIERLATVFKVTDREAQQRQLVLGEGKNLFAISNVTVLGYNQKYGTEVSSNLLSKKSENSRGVEVTMVQSFGEAFKIAQEEDFWAVIRAQQITIDGIPIDGLQRRRYFDRLRSPNCPGIYEFNANSSAGPFLPYSEKKVCDNRGIEIFSASVSSASGSSSKVFDVTQKLKGAAGSYSFQIPVMSSQLPEDLVASGTQLTISYRCNCEKEAREVTFIENLVVHKRNCGWGCESTVNEHMIGWNYTNLRGLLEEARAKYGHEVKLEILTINSVEGWNPSSSFNTAQTTCNAHNPQASDLFDHLVMKTVSSLPEKHMPYRWTFRILLPNGRAIDPTEDRKLECPK